MYELLNICLYTKNVCNVSRPALSELRLCYRREALFISNKENILMDFVSILVFQRECLPSMHTQNDLSMSTINHLLFSHALLCTQQGNQTQNLHSPEFYLYFGAPQILSQRGRKRKHFRNNDFLLCHSKIHIFIYLLQKSNLTLEIYRKYKIGL